MPLTRAQLERALGACRFSRDDIAGQLLAICHPAIGIDQAPERPIGRGSSKIFGAPDLPPGFVPPADKDFLAQLNLAEVAVHDARGLLPARGMLYLYGARDASELAAGPEPAAAFLSDLPVDQLVGGDDEGTALAFAPSWELDDDTVDLDFEDLKIFHDVMSASGHPAAGAGSLLGVPRLHREEMEALFDKQRDLSVLYLDGEAVGGIYRGGTFQVWATPAQIGEGVLNAYFEAGS